MSRPAPRPPAPTTRAPLAPSWTYRGVWLGVAAAYRRPATSLRTTRPAASQPRSGAIYSAAIDVAAFQTRYTSFGVRWQYSPTLCNHFKA